MTASLRNSEYGSDTQKFQRTPTPGRIRKTPAPLFAVANVDARSSGTTAIFEVTSIAASIPNASAPELRLVVTVTGDDIRGGRVVTGPETNSSSTSPTPNPSPVSKIDNPGKP